MTSTRMRAIVTTVPFGTIDPAPLKILADAGIDTTINPLARRLKADEVGSVIAGFDIVIAGTETISAAALEASGAKAICRVGIGLDGIDLAAARRHGIALSYTPDGPSPAVAELTIGLMLDLLREIGRADRGLRGGAWHRYSGRRLSETIVGVVGCGRIGHRVVHHLLGGFPGVRILAHDILAPLTFAGSDVIEWVGLTDLLARCDVVSLHVPLTPQTRAVIGTQQFALMRPEAVLVNTARGGLVDETALAAALQAGRIAGAAIDVFAEEPYAGPLTQCETAILTCHMGSMTRDCRLRMEVEAAEEAARFARGEPFRSPVPESEYAMVADRLVGA